MAYIQNLKDPSRQLTEKYYETLNNAVTNTEGYVDVYDFVPPEAAYPYIWISSQVGDQDNFASDKQGWAWQFTQLIEIVHGYPANMYGGKYELQLIQEQVISLIVQQNQWELDDFNIMNTEVDSSNLIQESTDTMTIYRQQLRFRHSIWQTA